MSDYWDTLSMQPMFAELHRRERDWSPYAMDSGRRNGKSYHAMYMAMYGSDPDLLKDSVPVEENKSGYARAACRCGEPNWPTGAACACGKIGHLDRKIDCPTPAAVEHSPLQVAFFNEACKEPIRDPSYRRMLVTFEQVAGSYVNSKPIEWPMATRDWGVIDEAVIYDEEGEIVFTCPVAAPSRISAGCVIRFERGQLVVNGPEWKSRYWYDDCDKPASAVTVRENTDWVPLSRTVGSKEIKFNKDAAYFFSETGFTGFDPGLPDEPKAPVPAPVQAPKYPDGVTAMFKARYGAYIATTPEYTTSGPMTREKILDAAKLIASNGSTPKYNFPVMVGIEHGQTCDSPEDRYYEKPAERLLLGSSPLQCMSSQGAELEVKTIADSEAKTLADSEDHLREIREFNRKIMLGAG